MTQILIGEVYNVEGSDYTKTINGVKEKRRRVQFRLGRNKPYKVQKTINGEKKDVYEKTFITCKCFNGLSETIEQYFGGDNKGRWIQLEGYYEENKYDKTVEVADPENENRILEFDVPTVRLEFIVTGFSFIGPAPEAKEKKEKSSGDGKAKVRVKTKSDGSGTSAADAEAEVLDDDDAPF